MAGTWLAESAPPAVRHCNTTLSLRSLPPSALPPVCPLLLAQVESALFDLFDQLGATDSQLDFPVLYASAKQGWASPTLPPGGRPGPGASMEPLLDAIIAHVPPPRLPLGQPFAMAVAMVERDPYVGRIVTGRVAAGTARVGDRVRVLPQGAAPAAGPAAAEECTRVLRLMKRSGLEPVAVEEAVAGDIVSLAGAPSAGIGDTVAAPEVGRGPGCGVVGSAAVVVWWSSVAPCHAALAAKVWTREVHVCVARTCRQPLCVVRLW